MATKSHRTLLGLQEALTTCRVREALHWESFETGKRVGQKLLAALESKAISLIASLPPIDRRNAFHGIVGSIANRAEEKGREKVSVDHR